MRKTVLAMVIIAMVCSVACNGSTTGGATGTPNPPFEGEKPEDVYIYKGATGNYGGTFVLAIPNDIKTLNPILVTDITSSTVLWYHLFRCLVDYRNGDNPPDYDSGVCTSYENSPDAKHWTFHLRRGVRWSDGEPFTADDVIFSYDVVRDERVQNAACDMFKEGADESDKPIYPDIEKLDDYTVRFNLHQPNGAFLVAILNLYLVPKHRWEQDLRAGTFDQTMKVNSDPKDVIGLGPFRFKEYVTGQRVVLERNPYFWKADEKGQRLPYLDRIIFVIAKDFNTITAKFQAGEIDGMDRVRAEEVALVKRMESDEIKVEDTGISLDSTWLAFNQNTGVNKSTGKPFLETWKQNIFREQKFRQAVSYAINREGLANTVFAGRGVPVYTLVTPGNTVWYSDDIQKYPYDPERAKQMLAEINLKDTNNDGFLEDAEGHTLEINLVTNSDNSQRVSVMGFVAGNLKDVGIKANVNPISFNVLIDMMQSVFNFDAIVLGWSAGVPPDPVNNKNVLLSSGLNHIGFPSQKKPSTPWEARIDELVSKFESTADMSERKQVFAEVQRIWSEQLPDINLIAAREAVAYKTRFSNIHPSNMVPRLSWNSEEIYAKQ